MRSPIFHLSSSHISSSFIPFLAVSPDKFFLMFIFSLSYPVLCLLLLLFLLYLLYPSSSHPPSFFIIFLAVALHSFSFVSYIPSLFSIFHTFFVSASPSLPFTLFFLYSSVAVYLDSFFILMFFVLCSTPSTIYYCTSFFIYSFISPLHISLPSFFVSLLSLLLRRVFYSCVSIFLLLPLFNPSCLSCFPCLYFLSVYTFSFAFLKRYAWRCPSCSLDSSYVTPASNSIFPPNNLTALGRSPLHWRT